MALPLDNLCIPKKGEEKVLIQQQLQSEIEALIAENEALTNSKNPTEVLCDINDADWVFDEKNDLIDKLNQMGIPETELPKTESENCLAVLCSLIKQQKLQLDVHNVLETQIRTIKKKIQDAEDLVLAQNDYLKCIERGEDSSKDNNTDEEKGNLQMKKDFQMYRTKLHEVLEQHFGDSNLKALVQDLTVAYFEEGDDKYVDTSKKYTLADVEVLEQAELVLRHPDDKMKIKFCNFN